MMQLSIGQHSVLYHEHYDFHRGNLKIAGFSHIHEFVEVLCFLCHRSSLLPFANYYIVCISGILLCVQVWTCLTNVILSSLHSNSGRHSLYLLGLRCCCTAMVSFGRSSHLQFAECRGYSNKTKRSRTLAHIEKVVVAINTSCDVSIFELLLS